MWGRCYGSGVHTQEPNEEATLSQLRGLSRALDGAIGIPGTGIRVGLDPILGLVPGVGDWIGGMLSGWIIIKAAKLGVSGPTLMRMLGNLAVDSVVGSVPVLGDIFDFGFRANERNMRLIEGHVQAPVQRRRADGLVVAGAVFGVLAIVVGAVVLTAWVVAQIFGALFG